MKPFDFIQPTDTQSAVAVLNEYGSDSRILCGGTDYLVDLKHADEVPRVVVDVSHLEELQGIEIRDDYLRIGAGVTHTEIMQSPLIKKYAPAMIEAAHTVGAVQTRNLGTLGGNLVTCVPSMDSGPTLLALDATVTIISEKGKRQSSLNDFFVGPRKTSLKPYELLLEIILPKESLGKSASFVKFGLRKGQALALVNATSALWVKNNKFTDVRIALGAVAPIVMRAIKAEAVLEGKAVSKDLIEEAARISVSEATPINDFRASKDYRDDLIEVGVRRTLMAALAIAENNS